MKPSLHLRQTFKAFLTSQLGSTATHLLDESSWKPSLQTAQVKPEICLQFRIVQTPLTKTRRESQIEQPWAQYWVHPPITQLPDEKVKGAMQEEQTPLV